MDERIVEIVADSLEKARTELYTDELIVLQEAILCRGMVEAIESIAETIEEAIVTAKNRIPAEAEIETEIKVAPERIVLQAKGADEESARKEVSLKKAEAIESISLHKKGRKGFLGFFKKPNVYEVTVFRQAVVEIRFREKARLRATVRGYLAKDLLESIHALRERAAQWEEMLQSLNPKNDPGVREELVGFRVPELLDPFAALEVIEGVCRKNESANWRAAIREAHREVLQARLQEWLESRGLDVQLADVFMFYTSIDWYPRHRKEPTGIPMRTRPSYGRHAPDERFREIIPHYSTDPKAFSEVERKLEVIAGLYELYKQCLAAKGQSEETATLKQKCVAILEARKRL